MKNNAKRMLAFLLAALLCVTMVVPAFATETTTEHDHDHTVVCDEKCEAAGHPCTTEHAKSEVVEVVAPVCTKYGYTLHYCFDCSHYYVTDPTEPVEGKHQAGTEVVVAGKDATCIIAGREDEYKCTVCGEPCDKDGGEVDTIPATGHNFVNDKCTICGFDQSKKCENNACKYVFTKVEKKPTATVDGIAVYTCTECGHVKNVTILATDKEAGRIYPDSLYSDIDFADGKVTDAFGNITFTNNGEVVIGKTDVTHNGTTLNVDALTINKQGTWVMGTFNKLDTLEKMNEFLANGFSIEALYLDNSTGSAGIVCMTEKPHGWGLAHYNKAGDANNNKPYFITGNGGTSDVWNAAYATATISDTELVHVVAVYDSVAKTHSIYVNGVECSNRNVYPGADVPGVSASTYTSNTGVAMFNTFCMGADLAREGYKQTGDFLADNLTIVDVKIYSAALTAEEVETLYSYVADDFTIKTDDDEDDTVCNCATTLKKVDEVTDQCTKVLAHYECVKCGKLYVDSAATQETTLEALTEINHSWEKDTTHSIKPGCTTYGFDYWACIICGTSKVDDYTTNPALDKLGHVNWTDKEAIITSFTCPTATEDGKVTWTCGRVNIDKDGNEVVCNHSEGLTAVLPKHEHKTVTVTRPATCYTYEYTFTYCTNTVCEYCGENHCVEADEVEAGYDVTVDGEAVHVIEFTKNKESGLDPDNHYEIVVTPIAGAEATCEKSGWAVRRCMKCSNLDEVIEYSLDGHVFDVEWDAETKTVVGTSEYSYINETPNCTKGLIVKVTCKFCTETKEITLLPALGHDYTDAKEVVVLPSCKQGDAGKGYTYKTCIVEGCGHQDKYNFVDFVKQTNDKGIYEDFETANEDHDITAGTAIPYRTGTCTVIGLEGYLCADCGTMVVVQTNDGTGLGHKAPDLTKLPAKAEGLEEYAGVEATCTEDGYTAQYKCTVCQEFIQKETTIEAFGHDMKEVVAVDATCATAGTKAYTYCTRCTSEEDILKLAEENAIAALGHNWVGGVCTTCEIVCNHKITTEAGHSVADCDDYGYVHVVCSGCGYEYWKDFVDVIGHKWVEETVKSTCTVAGSKFNKCSVCGEVDEDTIVALPLVHTNKAGETFTDKCTDTVEDRECVYCGEEIGKVCHTETIHVAPGCDSFGYDIEVCVDCGEAKETTITEAYNEHAWIADSNKTPVKPTHSTAGTNYEVCARCGKTQEVTVNALTGMNFDVIATNKNGYKQYADGSYVTVKVNVDANDIKAHTIGFKVTYDETVLDFVEGKIDSEETKIAGVEVTANQIADHEGYVTVIAIADRTSDGMMQNITFNGDDIAVVELTFRVTCADADVSATFAIEDIQLVDINLGNPVEDVEVTSTTDTITTVKFLDINHDTVVDLVDLAAIAKIWENNGVSPEGTDLNDVAADLDFDGNIAVSDVTLMMQYLAGKKAYADLLK